MFFATHLHFGKLKFLYKFMIWKTQTLSFWKTIEDGGI